MSRRLIAGVLLIAGLVSICFGAASGFYAYRGTESLRSQAVPAESQQRVLVESALLVPGKTSVDLEPGVYAVWGRSEVSDNRAPEVRWRVSGPDAVEVVSASTPVFLGGYRLSGVLGIQTSGEYEIESTVDADRIKMVEEMEFVIGNQPFDAWGQAIGVAATASIVSALVAMFALTSLVLIVLGVSLLLVVAWMSSADRRQRRASGIALHG